MGQIDDRGATKTLQYDALHNSSERTLVAEVGRNGYDAGGSKVTH
jgi:hypothetical protein